MEILPLGDAALLVRVSAAQEDSASVRAQVLEAARQLDAAVFPGLVELVPAYHSVGVFYDAATVDFDTMRKQVAACLTSRRSRRRTKKRGRTIEIPVCYDAEFALDLTEVAERSGLTPEEVVQRHAAAKYLVSCVGFAPGFGYLSGLPPELATPRRVTPRKQVPAGAVAIGGAQTGIYPQSSPGGWNIIGRTPLRLFDPAQEPAALLQAGDQVRLRAITRAKFDALSR